MFKVGHLHFRKKNCTSSIKYKFINNDNALNYASTERYKIQSAQS
jgi:hypothetical protein